MRVRGIDGREYDWRPRGGGGEEKSSFHELAGRLLKSVFPVDRVLEEVFLPGAGQPLYLDFYLPLRKLGVEVHGQQHYGFVPYFHGDERSFLRSNVRDQLKAEWCELNRIRLVVLPYYEGPDEWEERLRKA